MILKHYLILILLLIASFTSGLAQCNDLSVNDLLLLNNTPNRQIFEGFLNQRGFSFKDKKLEDKYLKYQYTSNDQGMMIEYSEAFEGDEHIIFVSVFLRERSKNLLLEDMNESGWIKYGQESQDPKGWVNQLYSNSNIPGFIIIYGKINDKGTSYYRLII